MLKQNCAENNNGSLVSKLADAEIKTEYCEYCITCRKIFIGRQM